MGIVLYRATRWTFKEKVIVWNDDRSMITNQILPSSVYGSGGTNSKNICGLVSQYSSWPKKWNKDQDEDKHHVMPQSVSWVGNHCCAFVPPTYDGSGSTNMCGWSVFYLGKKKLYVDWQFTKFTMQLHSMGEQCRRRLLSGNVWAMCWRHLWGRSRFSLSSQKWSERL